jgi:hypothetical protein
MSVSLLTLAYMIHAVLVSAYCRSELMIQDEKGFVRLIVGVLESGPCPKHYYLFIYLFIYFAVLLGSCTQSFTLAKQALYCLSHTYRPFCSGSF